MKKTMMTLAAVLCCALAFNACTKNDPSTPEEGGKTRAVCAKMIYKFTLGNDDMLKVLDLTVEYYDENGTVKTEPMTVSSWTKTVQSKTLPAILGARLKGQLKADVNIDEIEKFTAATGYNYSAAALDEDGEIVGKTYTSGSSSSLSMNGNKINIWMDSNKDGIRKFLLCFDANGIATSGTWE